VPILTVQTHNNFRQISWLQWCIVGSDGGRFLQSLTI